MVLKGSVLIWVIPKNNDLWATRVSVLLNILMNADSQKTPGWIWERILGFFVLLSSALR